jgi:two-component system CAI-1 autoinducer sensor kinase/phosphatase CqsS
MKSMISYLLDKLIYNKYHLFAFGFISILAHPTFWAWWTYVYPNLYESIVLRVIGALSCVVLLYMIYREQYFKNFLKFYWFFIVVYNLPFFFTVNLIKNNLIDVWLMEEIVMIFVVILFIPNIFLALISLILGVGGAVIFCLLTNSSNIYPLSILGSHSIQYGLALVVGYIFNYSNIMGIRAVEKAKILQSLGGSIAHEMRNPLGSIKQSSIILTDKVQRSLNSNNIKPNSETHAHLTDMLEISKLISYSSTRGNMVIDMILSNINGKEIDQNKFKIFPIFDIINIVMKEFAFEEGEKEKCSIDIQDNFHFKGDENMMVFVLFNLLKNALFYLKLYPESKITIYAKKAGEANDDDDKNFNYLYFKDTGAGIPSDKLESIFESFMTSGKEGGTGLGLPFCRRVITAFNGKIKCRSELGKYTEFVIKIPKISKVDKKNKSLFAHRNDKINNKNKSHAEKIIKENYCNKTILLVDDQAINIILTNSRLKKMNFNVINAKHGNDALDILNKKGDAVNLILMDLNMPEIDGYEVTKLIKLGNKNKQKEKFENFKNYNDIPIVAFSGDNDDKTITKIKNHKMNGWLGKDWSDDDLLKILKKVF